MGGQSIFKYINNPDVNRNLTPLPKTSLLDLPEYASNPHFLNFLLAQTRVLDFKFCLNEFESYVNLAQNYSAHENHRPLLERESNVLADLLELPTTKLFYMRLVFAHYYFILALLKFS